MRSLEEQLIEQLNKIEAIDEKSWNSELKNLSKLALIILREIKALESSNQINIGSGIDLQKEVRNFEVNLIEMALLHTGGSQSQSARLLGVSESNLSSKIKRYKISRRPSIRT